MVGDPLFELVAAFEVELGASFETVIRAIELLRLEPEFAEEKPESRFFGTGSSQKQIESLKVFH